MQQLRQLQALGLSANEAQVYLDLADAGKATAHAISKRCKLPRTTVYWLLENLAGKGLVTVEKKKDTSYFSVNKPQALLRMLEEEKRHALQQMNDREVLAKELVQSLEPHFKRAGFGLPRLQVFEGKDAVNSMLHDYLPLWQESAAQHDSTWWGYQDHTFAEDYMDWLKLTWQVKRAEERYCILTNPAEVEAKLAREAPHRKMKFVPPEYSFSSSIWAVGDYILLIMTSQKPHYAFQLRDPAFAKNLRTLFRILWERVF